MGTISAELVTSGEKRDVRGRRLAGGLYPEMYLSARVPRSVMKADV